jgi:hypothetical protein
MSSNTVSDPNTKAAETVRRPRPYSAPKLKRLGSVRDLTLGGTNGGPEFGRMGGGMGM